MVSGALLMLWWLVFQIHLLLQLLHPIHQFQLQAHQMLVRLGQVMMAVGATLTRLPVLPPLHLHLHLLWLLPLRLLLAV